MIQLKKSYKGEERYDTLNKQDKVVEECSRKRKKRETERES